jgi:glycine/D-amino acid oxidase-like deaminating enzyme
MSARTSTAEAIVIAGAGECGTRAAFTLREQGWDGRIVLVGAEAPYERPRGRPGTAGTAWRSGSACRRAAGW